MPQSLFSQPFSHTLISLVRLLFYRPNPFLKDLSYLWIRQFPFIFTFFTFFETSSKTRVLEWNDNDRPTETCSINSILTQKSRCFYTKTLLVHFTGYSTGFCYDRISSTSYLHWKCEIWLKFKSSDSISKFTYKSQIELQRGLKF